MVGAAAGACMSERFVVDDPLDLNLVEGSGVGKVGGERRRVAERPGSSNVDLFEG